MATYGKIIRSCEFGDKALWAGGKRDNFKLEVTTLYFSSNSGGQAGYLLGSSGHSDDDLLFYS